jgi:hypothetical protein
VTLRIATAAVRRDGLIFSIPRPGRHHDIIPLAVQAGAKAPIRQGEQGFLTSEGDFVDRRWAAQIAFQAGQIIELKAKLYSEDLW